MFDFSAQIREVQKAGVGLVLVLAAAVVGLVWLSVAAVRLVAVWTDPVLAPALIGGAFLAPLLLIALWRGLKGRPAPTPPPAAAAFAQGSGDDLTRLTKAAQELAVTAPLAATAMAALAGILAVRFPGALALLLQVVMRRPPPDPPAAPGSGT